MATKVQHLRNAVIRSLTKEEVILAGLLIISLDSCTIKKNGSLTGYPIAELRNSNSKLAEQPVLFTRYGQRPQVLPDHNYSPDIMQQFIDRCTNIKIQKTNCFSGPISSPYSFPK
jgi:hypothetical protein